MPLSAGDKLGPYEILGLLGAGGMGEVWKARDTRLDRIVAIKQIKQPHGVRFEQEARAIAALNHPHICQIYDIGPDYLVMEYIDGAPLRGPLPAEKTIRLAVQIAGALEDAHAHGIIHRDLKPGNILVNSKGQAKLLDFGLAKLAQPSENTETLTGTVMGTPAYMSPEQLEGKPLDARSDVFSFGVVLYELVAGRRAFESLAAILRDEPAPLQSPAAGITAKCLAKQASQRFQSMAELRSALEKLAGSSGERQPSIAVLPFANLSGDKEQEYFSDGLADEIINALAQLPGLKVTARTSAFAFRGKEQDIRKIAEALDVRTILEGSVRRAGNRIRVTAQLINAQDGYHLWSQRYDGELADVFEVQEKIALAITGALQVQLMPESGVPQRYKPSLPAYEAYLKARHYELKLAPGSWEKAKQCYEEAIALDPKFAVAYSELAGLYSQAAALGLRPPQEVLLPMQECAQKALSLDASLPEAHSLRGLWTALFDNDWNEAERLFANAMAGNSVPPMARFFYVVFLLSVARPLEAVEQMQHALEHDPLFPLYRAYLVLGLWEAGRDEEALLEANQILELVENFPGVYNILAMYHAERGAFSEALSFAEKAHSLAPHLPQIAGLLAGLLFRTGNAARAQEILKNLGSPEAYGVPRALALSFQVQGETEKAADWLERAIDQRDTSVAGLVRYPLFKALLAGRRWPVLAKRMNLPHEP